MIREEAKYNSVQVAYYIIASMNERGLDINMTKLQKLLYIAYGSHLAVSGERLTNEHPQAWPYGPVFPTTRNRLLKKDFGSITMSDDHIGNLRSDAYLRSLIGVVIDGFGKNNATTLTVWSHEPDSPWDLTRRRNGFVWGDRIPDEYIQDYFNKIVVTNNA